MIDRKLLAKLCSDAYSLPNNVLDIFANKSKDTALAAPIVFEFFTLLSTVLHDENSLYVSGNPEQHNYAQGVYFYDEEFLVCVDIEKDSLQYVTFWTTNIIRESKHFTACSGSYMFSFSPVKETYLPNIFSYFVIDKDSEEIVPILSLNYLDKYMVDSDFVTPALLSLKEKFQINVNLRKISSDNIVV